MGDGLVLWLNNLDWKKVHNLKQGVAQISHHQHLGCECWHVSAPAKENFQPNYYLFYQFGNMCKIHIHNRTYHVFIWLMDSPSWLINDNR